MNVPDLRNVDFDAYRERAFELRRQARQESFDRLGRLLKALLARRPQGSGRASAAVAPMTARLAA